METTNVRLISIEEWNQIFENDNVERVQKIFHLLDNSIKKWLFETIGKQAKPCSKILKFNFEQPKLSDRDLMKIALLHWTCWEMVTQFVDHYSLTNPEFFPEIFQYSSQIEKLTVVKYIVETLKFDYHWTNENGETAIWTACYAGSFEIVKYLIENTDIDYNKVDAEFQTPFSMACIFGYLEIIKYMIESAGVSLNIPHSIDLPTPLMLACFGGKLEVTKYLVEEKQVDLYQTDPRGENAFSTACFRGHFEIVKYFLERAETNIVELLNKVNSKNETPLIVSCQRPNIEIAKYLVEKRMTVQKEGFVEWLNVQNAYRHTALDAVKMSLKNVELEEYLTSKGAKSIYLK